MVKAASLRSGVDILPRPELALPTGCIPGRPVSAGRATGGVITGPDGQQSLEDGTVDAAATPELAEQVWAVLGPGR